MGALKIGDRVRWEDARAGMVVTCCGSAEDGRPFSGTPLTLVRCDGDRWEVTGGSGQHLGRKRFDSDAADLRVTALPALPEESPVAEGNAKHAAPVAFSAIPLCCTGCGRVVAEGEVFHECGDVPLRPAVAWDGIPAPEERRRLECRHGRALSADCHVCDYDRRYYARRENTAALTEVDTRTLIAPEGSVAEAGWVKCKAAPPQTRETRLEAAGWKVTR